jgi:hypothetical protein
VQSGKIEVQIKASIQLTSNKQDGNPEITPVVALRSVHILTQAALFWEILVR